MLHTCLVLNGPPNCGKDTLASMLRDYGFKPMMMKHSLYAETAKYFKVPIGELIRRATDRYLKEEKWFPLQLAWEGDVRVLSPREALIHTSENYIKPEFGDDFFGKAAAEYCVEQNAILSVFSDGGFATEIPPLQEVYKNLVIFRLMREGCTFEGDSRKYLEGFENTYDLTLVTGTPRLGIELILDTVGGYLGNLSVA